MNKANKIKEEAARWFLWLHEKGAKKSDIDVFLQWQNTSPEHKAAYQEIEAFWEFCDSLDDLPWPSAKEIARDRYDGSIPIALPNATVETVVSVAANYKRKRTNKVGKRVTRVQPFYQRFGYAASALFVFGVALLASTRFDQFFSDELQFQTVKAEQQEHVLEDGSRITLGPSTKLSIDFDNKQRRIVLHGGEAFFDVAKEVSRPFIVDTGSGSVQAIGTSFNINRRAQHLTVSVLEGVIRFSKATRVDTAIILTKIQAPEELQLEQGQRLVYDSQTQTLQLEDKVLPRASSWREGKLAYENERLSNVIEDVNRYSNREFVIGDATVGNLVYTGTVFNNDISNWAEALVKTFPVRLLELDNRVILLSPLNSAG